MSEFEDEFKKSEKDFSKISEYLKEYYQPENDCDPEQPKNFEQFWSELSSKIEAEDPVHKISKSHKIIKENYLRRERNLENFAKGVEPVETQINSVDLDWSTLDLSKEQKAKLKILNEKWTSYSKEQEALINGIKTTLKEEINKDNPNINLIDKYHKDILDKEITIKRKEASTFLEKRRVLNKTQIIKLIRLLNR